MSWQSQVDFITNGGVAETAHLIGYDGNIAGSSIANLKTLPYYNKEITISDTEKKTVVVYEFNNLLEGLKNNGKTKAECGIWIYGQKYYTVSFDAERQTWYLKKDKGGACITWTKTFLIIGTFNQEYKMQNGISQNNGELNKRVEKLGETLRGQGY